jgi:hypothetical protein
LLLEKGANPNARSDQGDTALAIAIERNDDVGVSMARALLDKGANPNLQDSAKNYPVRNYPIMIAIKYKKADMVALLIAKSADYHVKDTNGVALIDIAKQSGDAQIVQLIQDPIDKEKAYIESLRSPERFNEIIRRYSFYSCSYQYWSYYLASRQDPDKDPDTNQKIAASKAALATLLEQIQKYYPSTTTEELQTIADNSAKAVSEPLDAMISNRNRAENGIGKDDDADRRCRTIADSTKPGFIPGDLRK